VRNVGLLDIDGAAETDEAAVDGDVVMVGLFVPSPREGVSVKLDGAELLVGCEDTVGFCVAGCAG
jgi:hypothetical protein